MRTGIIVTFTALALATSGPADEPPKLPLSPRRVSSEQTTVGAAAAELGRKTGVPVTVAPDFAARPCAPVADAPFWDAIDKLAADHGLRVAVRDAGRAVELVPKGASREVASTAGPFRVVARQVTGKALLAEGLTVHEVQLDLHWEPRYPVFRVDSYPHITHAADDRGVALQPQSAGAKTQPTGAVHTASAKLGGVTREAKRIGVLKGTFTVTASEKLLPFAFDLPAAKGPPVTLEKVTAELKSWTKDEDTWVAELELTYPPTLPEFESFEAAAFTTANRARLVGPGGKAIAPDSQAVSVAGRRVSATYYFKHDRETRTAGPGWKLELDAASTPVEFRVPFELRDVPLP